MLNVYLSAQKVDKGFPSGEAHLKLIKFRKLGTRAEAFEDVRSQFGDFVDANPNYPISDYCDAFYHLITSLGRAEQSDGASTVINGALLCVTYKEGAECELVAPRGY